MKFLALIPAIAVPVMQSYTTRPMLEQRSDAKWAAAYIEKNLEKFKQNINTPFADEHLNATSIEFKREIYVINRGGTAWYLDFNGNNGHILIDDDYKVLSYSPKGDLGPLRWSKEIYYSIYDGFLAREYWNKPLTPINQLIDWSGKEIIIGKKHEGQYRSGPGHIYDLDKYIHSKYGVAWTPEMQKILTGKTSVIKQKDLGLYYNDGNCVIASVYNLLSYYRDNIRYSKLPSRDVDIDITKDPLYPTGRAEDARIGKSNLIRRPALYMQVRDVAIQTDNYNNVGVNKDKIDDLINLTAGKYKYNISARNLYQWKFTQNITTFLNLGFPLLFSTIRGTYGAHTMMVLGYKIIARERKLWQFRYKEYKKFLKLNDNISSTHVYFDLTDYENDFVNGMFAMFTG